jgi:hypothetical protein
MSGAHLSSSFLALQVDADAARSHMGRRLNPAGGAILPLLGHKRNRDPAAMARLTPVHPRIGTGFIGLCSMTLP